MQDLFDLSARNALVTGASSGLGRHFARTLARAGANVALAARRLEPLEALAEELDGLGVRGVPLVLDVRDGESVADAFARGRGRARRDGHRGEQRRDRPGRYGPQSGGVRLEPGDRHQPARGLAGGARGRRGAW